MLGPRRAAARPRRRRRRPLFHLLLGGLALATFLGLLSSGHSLHRAATANPAPPAPTRPARKRKRHGTKTVYGSKWDLLATRCSVFYSKAAPACVLRHGVNATAALNPLVVSQPGALFVHIPKNAGTSVRKLVPGRNGNDDHLSLEEMARHGVAPGPAVFSFAFARHPLDRLVSVCVRENFSSSLPLPPSHPGARQVQLLPPPPPQRLGPDVSRVGELFVASSTPTPTPTPTTPTTPTTTTTRNEQPTHLLPRCAATASRRPSRPSSTPSGA